MTIDFRKAFVELLTKHEIHHLPDQQIIDQNSDIAQLIWKNYSPPSEYSWDEESERSIKINTGSDWGQILSAYKNHTQFWEKAFESNNSYEILLTDNFKIYFPFITSFWLSNDEKLLLAFEKTKNKEFTDLINDSTTKEDTYKTYLLNNTRIVKTEDLQRFQDDKKFVATILSQYPSMYCDLNEENKNNHDYIKLALRLKTNIKNIPEKYQNNATIRDYWFKIHTKYFDSKDILEFSDDEKRNLFLQRPDFLGSLLNHKPNSNYTKYAIELLSTDILKYINNFGMDTIKALKLDLFCNEGFKLSLNNFLASYCGTDPSSKTDEKIFSLIKDKPEFTNVLDDNLFYIFRKNRLSKTLINNIEYNQWIEIILDKNHKNELTSDNARRLINALKKITKIEVLKELPKTKDLFTHYQHERLLAILPAENKKSVKIKL